MYLNLHTHKDQKKKKKKVVLSSQTQVSEEHLVIIRINFEEDDNVGVLERINNRHNEISAAFFFPFM